MTPSAQEAEPGRILVVDDNEMNRDMLSRRLQRSGHTVGVAVNGLDALERLGEGAFDLVLLDLMMPEMNGFELLERLRGDDGFHHLPVILISALDDDESVVKGIRMGADDHLPKPFNPHVLRARVDACLAKKRLHDRRELYARSLERELDIAREIQAGFLPEKLPASQGWEFAARCVPARSVGGDFYDAFVLPGDRQVVLVVADICDKGVGAALFMALFRSLLRALAERTMAAAASPGISRRSGTEENLTRLLESVNDYIARTHGQANMFATMFVAVLDLETGEIVYVNGGHEAPVLTGPDGISVRLEPTGPAVGMLPSMEFEAKRAALAPGRTLVVFTDGITESRDRDGAFFTADRLLSLLETPGASATATLDGVLEAVGAHSGDAEPFDDITLLAVRRSGA